MGVGSFNKITKKWCNYQLEQWQRDSDITTNKIIDENLFWYFYCKSIFPNIFKVENLPQTVPQEKLFDTLWYGNSCLFSKIGNDLFALPYIFSGSSRNIYGDFINFQPMGFDGTKLPEVNANEILDPEKRNGVIVWLDLSRSIPFSTYVLYFGDKISNLQSQTDEFIEASKILYTMSGSPKDKLSIKNIYNDKSMNVGYVILDEKTKSQIDQGKFTPAPNTSILSNVLQVKQEYTSRLLAMLGISSSSSMKKERVQSAEIDVNDEHTQSYIMSMKTSLEKGLEDVNKCFGTNIKISLNNDFLEDLDQNFEEKSQNKGVSYDKSNI